MTLGQRVKAKRISEGLTLRELEKLVGVSFSSLARLERNKGAATPGTTQRVTAWLEHGTVSKPREKKTGWFITFEQRLAKIEKHLGLDHPSSLGG